MSIKLPGVSNNCLSPSLVLFLIPQQHWYKSCLYCLHLILWISLARSWYFSTFSSFFTLIPRSSGIATPLICYLFNTLWSAITKSGLLAWIFLSVHTLVNVPKKFVIITDIKGQLLSFIVKIIIINVITNIIVLYYQSYYY